MAAEAVEMDAPTIYATLIPSGGWRVTGTRVSLDSIVHAYWDGRQPEAIVADFPSLTLEQVHGAIAFYLHNKSQIDAYMAAQDVKWSEFQRESAAHHSPLLRRIRGADAVATGS
jgi:uncharacterized protein (DUF433 family)